MKLLQERTSMDINWKKVTPYLVGAVGGFALSGALVLYQLQRATGDAVEAAKFLYGLGMLRQYFVGELDDNKLYRGALSGLLSATGDPYTVFLDEKDFAAMEEMRTGSFGGVGMVFGMKNDGFVVISVLEDNPAAEAGVKSGEKIIAVDGKPTKGMHMDEVAYAIRGDVGTQVAITFADKNNKERVVKITRGLIKSPSVVAKSLDGTDKKIGYVRIGQFNDNTGSDFRDEIHRLAKEGMKGLILDLRYNPGGLLDQAVYVCQELVPKGDIVSTISKIGKKTVAQSYLEKPRWPLVVLVNEGSASASEIVAGAVKDTKAGVLMGTKTFGKGSVQAVYPLGDENTAMKVTVAKYYTPSGVCINEVGIEPDIKVELPEDAKKDVQLEAAKKYLLEQIK